MKILVTDAQVRNAVAMIRALGKRGYEIYTCDSDKIATGFYSKYVKKYFVHPNNLTSELEYIESLNNFLKKEQIDILLPVRDESVFVISKHREKILKEVKIPIPNHDKIKIALNKALTCQIAKKLDIPIPTTYYPEKEDDLDEIKKFPVVLKPVFGSGSRGIVTCKDLDTLKREFNLRSKEYGKYIVQDFVPINDKENSEFDWYGIYDWDSNLKGHGCFRRIRSYPLNSGPSTFKESVELPQINKYANKILTYLKWQGLAQLDFRMDARDNTPKLMEINPRLWASVQHSINIGLDVPKIWVDLALGHPIPEQPLIKTGVKSRWLLPADILWFISAPKTFENIKNFFNFRNSSYELLDKDDWKPILAFFIASLDYLFHKEKRKMIIRQKL